MPAVYDVVERINRDSEVMLAVSDVGVDVHLLYSLLINLPVDSVEL